MSLKDGSILFDSLSPALARSLARALALHGRQDKQTQSLDSCDFYPGLLWRNLQVSLLSLSAKPPPKKEGISFLFFEQK